MMFSRHPLNPLIKPQQVRPSRPDYEVIGAFNAGATLFKGETILLLRVAERPLGTEEGWIACPYLNEAGELVLHRVRRDDPDYDTRDPRLVQHRPTGKIHLTSISHLRLARGADGMHFTISDQPWLTTQAPYEAFGIEDARITQIDDTFYVNYTAVSPHGIATGLASTRDFEAVERCGIMFPPSNRDVAIFPQAINGLYVCYHRPMPGEFGQLNIWMATSPDMAHWGNHRLVLTSAKEGWDSGRIGGGAPPVWTEEGWLSIYHAADRQNRYCLGAFLTAHDDPAHILARSLTPIFEPEAPYETDGFFANVVFTCGVTVVEGRLRVYYGASDETTSLAEVPLQTLLQSLLNAS
jgi:beta-1,2-mannobiose phosphorylase / 1,2-beta-oligomannan phosphorylase